MEESLCGFPMTTLKRINMYREDGWIQCELNDKLWKAGWGMNDFQIKSLIDHMWHYGDSVQLWVTICDCPLVEFKSNAMGLYQCPTHIQIFCIFTVCYKSVEIQHYTTHQNSKKTKSKLILCCAFFVKPKSECEIVHIVLAPDWTNGTVLLPWQLVAGATICGNASTPVVECRGVINQCSEL